MITEKECIALIKKYETSRCPGSVFNGDCELQYEGGRWQEWSMYRPWEDGGIQFRHAKFEDVKDQIIDFFLKVDPDLEQKFLNKKHQNILKQPKILETL